MIKLLLVTVIVILTSVLIILLWLLREYKKLNSAYQAVKKMVADNSQDIAGLCSAAVIVDKHITRNDEKMRRVVEDLSQLQQQKNNESHSTQPYHNAIQKIHDGATVIELVKDCGISRDEAMLLIRLHGADKQLEWK